MSSKTSFLVIIAFVLCLSTLLGGCWSYRGLDQIEIVGGMAIDEGSADAKYKITMEIFDVSSPTKEEGSKQKMLQAEGQSIFHAVRNAKKKLLRRPYFSHMEIVFINQKIAKEQGLYSFIDFFLRDGEIRDTMHLAISQEETAATLFRGEPADSPILSIQMSRSIQDDSKITGSTYDNNMINIYNTLASPGIDLVLPVIHLTENQDKKVAELNGIALFDKDKLKGFIGPEETKYFLLIMDELKGGIISLPDAKAPAGNVDLEIAHCSTKQSYEYSNEQLKIILEPSLKVFLGSINYLKDSLTLEDIHQIEASAEQYVAGQAQSLIKKVQEQYALDIFGFGNLIYRKKPQLWQQFSGDWQQHFANLQVEIKPKISIINTAFVKNNAPRPSNL